MSELAANEKQGRIFHWEVVAKGLALLWLSFPALCGAVDYSLLGFGTIGYARSNLEEPYLRFIDRQGTFRSDSLIGLQADVEFNPRLSATLQVVGAASRDSDTGMESSVRWAFVSFRPDNQTIVRAGRFRPPVLKFSQSGDVGVTHDLARLPVESYSLSPVYDIDGVSVSRGFLWHDHDAKVEFYAGTTTFEQKIPFQRDVNQSFVSTDYLKERINFTGFLLSIEGLNYTYRFGHHYAKIKPRNGQVFLKDPSPIAVPGPPPIGGLLFVPGPPNSHISIHALTLGADWTTGPWSYSVEVAKRIAHDTNMGPSSTSASVLVQRVNGRWTPYFLASVVRPSQNVRDYYRLLNSTAVPLAMQGPPFFVNANLHRTFSDSIFVFDQASISGGSSYSLDVRRKLKFEVSLTKVGLASVLLDGIPRGRPFRVISASYNFVF